MISNRSPVVSGLLSVKFVSALPIPMKILYFLTIALEDITKNNTSDEIVKKYNICRIASA